ncbi:MAG: glycosyltransferase family 2 protein [Candidatus Omnitrophota bacterium]
MTQENKKVYIVIVNWNNALVTIECLRSLENVSYPNKEIHLIDNGSSDDSLRILEDYRQQSPIKDILTLISLKENLGFAGGNNVGIKMALERGAEYVLLLNNDTIVTPDFLTQLVQSAQTIQNLGILGTKINHYPDKDIIWFSRGKIDYFRGAFYHINKERKNLVDSDFITGCLMFIPASVLQDVNLFDERYFLNAEDVDLSQRIKKAGYKLVVNQDAVIYHQFSASMGGIHSKRNQYYFHRNRMLFFSKNLFGLKKYLFFCFQFILAIPAWLCIQFIQGHFVSIQGAWLGYVDYFKGRFGRSRYF